MDTHRTACLTARILRNVKKKIAFVVWTLADMGGSERVVYDIVRNLGKNRYSSIVVGFEDGPFRALYENCLLYTSDAADDLLCVDLGGRRIIKKKTKQTKNQLD